MKKWLLIIFILAILGGYVYAKTPHFGGITPITNPCPSDGSFPVTSATGTDLNLHYPVCYPTTLKTGVDNVLGSWNNQDGTTDYAYRSIPLQTLANEIVTAQTFPITNGTKNYVATLQRNNYAQYIPTANPNKFTAVITGAGPQHYQDTDGVWYDIGYARMATTDFKTAMNASTTVISLLRRFVIGETVFANNSTFNPATGANDPVDGYWQFAVQAAWNLARNGAVGANVSVTALVDQDVGARQRIGPSWDVYRLTACFATGSIGAGATVSSSTLSFFHETHDLINVLPAGFDWINIYAANPAAFNTLTNNDFSATGTPSQVNVAYSSQANISTMVNSSFVGFTFNAAGNSYISVTGDTCFMPKVGYDASDTAPVNGGVNDQIDVNFTMADGTNKPLLSVTFTPAASSAAIIPKQTPLLIQF